MSTLFQDLVYGLRMMRRAPGFTLAAVLTLALGIGVNAATFSIVNVLSLKQLPYADPERVAFVMAWDAQRRDLRMNLPLADVADIAGQAHGFEGVAAYEYWSANLTGNDAPERAQAYRVTGNTFALLGAPALAAAPLAWVVVRVETVRRARRALQWPAASEHGMLPRPRDADTIGRHGE